MTSEFDVISQFRQAMGDKDIFTHDEIIASGKIQRFHVDGDKKNSKNGWLILFPGSLTDPTDAPAGAFGCNKRYGEKVKFTWRMDSTTELTPEQRKKYAIEMRERAERKAREEAERHAAAASRAEHILTEAGEPTAEHPYCKRKKVKAYEGMRVGAWPITNLETGEVNVVSKNALLIPMRDVNKRVWGVQAIFPDKRNFLKRDKDFLAGSRIEGCFFTLGKPVDKTIILGEGFATCATIHDITRHAVVVCFVRGNLKNVAIILRKKFPDYRIIVAADNDQWTTEPVNNPGLTDARAAAIAVGGLLAVPPFTDADKTAKITPTDFNDLAELKGPEAVLHEFSAPFDPSIQEPEVAPHLHLVDTSLLAPEPPAPEATQEDRPDIPTPIQGNSYFSVLGYEHGNYYFFQKEKRQIMVYTKGDFSDGGFIELAPLGWWEGVFPAQKGGIEKRFAMNALVRFANARGIYDMSRIRGRGAWRDKGRSIYHHGNMLTVDGVETEITDLENSAYVYELSKSLPELTPTALNDEEGKRILDLASIFRWSKPGSAALLAGWVALAPLCGAIKWRPHIWITGGAGSGKAQPHSSDVLTPSGWVKMGDIKKGDLVTTPDNGYGRVIGLFPQGSIPVFKITFADGRTVRASADHIWKVRVKHAWRLRTTEEMIEILSRKTRASISLAIPLCDPLELVNNQKINLPLHPYVLGVLLGDGCMGAEYGGNAGTQVGLTCFDPEIANRVALLTPAGNDLYGSSIKGKFTFKGLDQYGKSMRHLIKDLRLLGTRSHNKFIPKEYLNSSIADRVELLKGLMDTDGTVCTAGGISYCTISKQLCEDVVTLVRSLGGAASIYEKKTSYTHNGEKKTGQLAYNISIRLRDRAMAFHLERKVKRAQQDYQYADCLYLNVESIVPDGEEECSCIAIDHPDRLYVTDNFVVTHNTTILNEFVHHLMDGRDLYAQGSSSEAGIRQELKGDALPVLFDESESNTERDSMRIQNVLSLIRQASSELQAKTFKGTAGGDALSFHIRSMFCLSSIQVGIKFQADIERLTVLALQPKRDDTDAAGTWVEMSGMIAALQADEELPGRLFRRSLELLPVTLKNIRIFAEVAATKFGSQRDGDQYGSLLAGAFSLISTKEATYADAAELIEQYDWSEHRENNETDEGSRAIAALMEAHVRVGGGPEVTVNELIRVAKGYEVDGLTMANAAANAVLERHGMRVNGLRLVLSNTSRELRRLMEGTEFEADLRGVLLRSKGADKFDNQSMKFNGVASKCISIPLEDLISDELPQYVRENF